MPKKVYTQLPFEVSPEFYDQFTAEAKRLGISKIELFRRMFKFWREKQKTEEGRAGE